MIDKEDKAAEISVIVLPDYDVSSGDMHEYGYTWDGMLPLKRQTALRLWGMGLQVYKLNSNDTETEIAKYEDLDDEHGLYGIEKPIWKRFCEHEKSVAYFAAKHEFADAAAIVTSGEMDYVESSNLENFINQNFEERYDLESYLADKGTPDSKELIAYTQMFLTDYSKRIWTEKLKEYGWIESDIPRALMRRLKNEEMQKCVKEIILSENQTTKVTEVTKESSTRNFLPVYLKSSEYAMEHGELDLFTAEQFIEALKGKTDEDYESKYRQPSEEAKKQFEKVEARLRKNVPEVMRNKPNWVIVRTRENMETGRLDKFLIDTHTGKFAESNNPETWTDFDTACKYAKENGGVALAYALDGKDNIACIDLDGCIEKNGDFSPLAKKVFDNCDGTYCEKSVSGKGLHFFGITKGADLRAFSKDGDMEYYQGGHFIAMTGDDYGNTELKSFDTPEMKAILESKLEKRTEWKGAGTGVEGLSLLDDREVLDKAFASKNGEKIRQLYNGRDLQNNHSNSDMSLMNYLAFWCNHDIDQMLRINATSGLFRADKPQSYYEHTAIKAVKGTPVYTPPKASNNKPSGNGNGSDKGGK